MSRHKTKVYTIAEYEAEFARQLEVMCKTGIVKQFSELEQRVRDLYPLLSQIELRVRLDFLPFVIVLPESEVEFATQMKAIEINGRHCWDPDLQDKYENRPGLDTPLTPYLAIDVDPGRYFSREPIDKVLKELAKKERGPLTVVEGIGVARQPYFLQRNRHVCCPGSIPNGRKYDIPYVSELVWYETGPHVPRLVKHPDATSASGWRIGSCRERLSAES